MKNLIVLALIVVGWNAKAQESELFDYCKNYVYFYKVDVKTAKMIKSSTLYHTYDGLGSFFLTQTPMDSIQSCNYKYPSFHLTEKGLYLVLQADHNQAKYELAQIDAPTLNTFNWNGKYYLEALDQNEQKIDVEIRSERTKLLFDESKKAYYLPSDKAYKKLKEKAVEVIHQNDTFLFDPTMYKTGEKNAVRKAKWKTIKGNFLNTTGIKKSHAFRKSFGYLTISQPKYRIGDTLKAAVVLYKKEGKPALKNLDFKLEKGWSYRKKSISLNAFANPIKPGVYEIKFPLGDTLELSSYSLGVYDKKENELLSVSMQLQDYELPEYKVKSRSLRQSVYLNEPLVLFASIKDYNGFNAFGSTAEVTVRLGKVDSMEFAVRNLPASLPKTYKRLSNVGETRIEIPVEPYQNISGRLSVELKIKSPGSFVKIDNYTFDLVNKENSLSIYQENEVVKTKIIGKHSDKNPIIEYKVIKTDNTQLKFSKPLNESIPIKEGWSYIFADWNNESAYYNCPTPNFLSKVKTERVGDSIVVNIDTSFLKNGMIHFIEKNKVKRTLNTIPNQLVIHRNEATLNHHISVLHQWNGKHVVTNIYPIPDEENEVSVLGDLVVYPHKTSDYEIVLKNEKGEAYPSSHLTAVAYNNKFESKSTSTTLSPGTPVYIEPRSYTSYIQQASYHKKAKINTETAEILQLRKSEFYKHCFPEVKFEIEEVPSKDTNCYFEPHLYYDAEEIIPNYVLINGDFHFLKYFDNTAEWPIQITDTIVPLIRAGKNYYKFKSYIPFKKGVKYIVRINAEGSSVAINNFSQSISSEDLKEMNKKQRKIYVQQRETIREQRYDFQKFEASYLFDHTVLLHSEKFCDHFIVKTRHEKLKWVNVQPNWLFKIGPFNTDSVWVTTVIQGDTLNYAFKFRKGILNSLGDGKVSSLPTKKNFFNTRSLKFNGTYQQQNNKEQELTPVTWDNENMYLTFDNNKSFFKCGMYAIENSQFRLVLNDKTGNIFTSQPFSYTPSHSERVYIDLRDSLVQIRFIPETWKLNKVIWNSSYSMETQDNRSIPSSRYKYENPIIKAVVTDEFNQAISDVSFKELTYDYENYSEGHRGRFMRQKTFKVQAPGYTTCIIPNVKTFGNTDYTFRVTLRKVDSLKLTTIPLTRNRNLFFNPWNFGNIGLSNKYSYDYRKIWYYSSYRPTIFYGLTSLQDKVYIAKKASLKALKSSRSSRKQKERVKNGKYNFSHDMNMNYRSFRGDIINNENESYEISGIYELKKSSVASVNYSITSNGYAIKDYNRNSTSLITPLEENKPISLSLDYGDTLLKRTDFRDQAIWIPNLTTDKNGRAKFTTTFPDDITSWHFKITGISPLGKHFAWKETIKSYKPITASLDIPRFAISGDKIQFIGKTTNFTEDEYSGKTFFRLNNKIRNEHRIQLKKLELDSLVYTIPNDTFKLEYQVKLDTGYWDAEEREIPVLQKGIQISKTKDYILKKDTSITVELPAGDYEIQLASGWNNYFKTQIKDLKDYEHKCTEQLTSKLLAQLIHYEMLTDSNYLDVKQSLFIKHQIKSKIKKLFKRHNSDYFWGWWNNSSTNYFLTCYLYEVMEYADDLDFDTENLWEVSPYALTSIYNNDNVSLEERLYAACLKTDLEDVDYKKFARITNTKPKNKTQLILLSKLKQNTNQPFSMAAIDSIASLSARGGKYWEESQYSWMHNRGFLTRMVYNLKSDAMASDQELNQIVKTVLEFNNNKHNTFQKAQFLQMAYDHSSSLEKGSLLYTVNGIQGDSIHTSSKKAYGNVVKLKSDQKQTLVLKTDGAFGFVSVHEKKRIVPTQNNNEYFKVKTNISNVDSTITKFKKGNQFTLNAEIEVLQKSEYIMVEIGIPAGVTYSNKHSISAGTHREYFKDKLIVYYEVLNKGTHHINIPLTGRFKGEFTVNPVKVENMYFPSISGWNKTKKMVIE